MQPTKKDNMLKCPYMPRSDTPIVWIKSNAKIAGGRNVNNDNKYSITGNNSREQNLRIANISQENIGEYRCDAVKNGRSISYTFELIFCRSDNSKNKCTVHTVNSNSSVIYVVCSCNYSKPTGEFLTKTFDGLYHVDTLYLKNILTLDISHCHCDVVSDDSQCKNDLLGSGQRLHMGASLTLSLAVLCIFVAIGIYMYIIRDKESPTQRICQTWNRASAHNIINNCGDQNIFYLANDVSINMAERPGNELECYSSIDKRLVLGIGLQNVSYLSYSGASPENAIETDTKNQTNNDKPVKQEQDEQLQKLSLNYIEVMFDSTQHSSKFYIRGDNDKTPYAEIDFTLHADPLPDIDSSEGDDGESDDDFMSLSGIQNWMQPS